MIQWSLVETKEGLPAAETPLGDPISYADYIATREAMEALVRALKPKRSKNEYYLRITMTED